jgi:hypothetical protein
LPPEVAVVVPEDEILAFLRDAPPGEVLVPELPRGGELAEGEAALHGRARLRVDGPVVEEEAFPVRGEGEGQAEARRVA